MNEANNRYLHPQWQEGIKSHVPHHESLHRVKAHLEPYSEYGLSGIDLDNYIYEVTRRLLVNDHRVLSFLRSPAIPGMPIDYADPDRYLSNAIFITRPNRGQNRLHAVSYPNAGRAVTRREGYVLSDGQVMLDHDTKGVGLTRAVDKYHADKTYGPGGEVGISQDYQTDMQGTAVARAAGILTPFILPPMVYDQVYYDGRFMPAAEYSQDPMYCIQRLWACNYRVSSIYRSYEGGFTFDDIPLILKDIQLSVRVARSRVKGYIKNCRQLSDFNKTHQTNYRLGCSPYFTGEFDYDDYLAAFRQQLVHNAANSIAHSIFHENLSPQNVSLAGEYGDWDLFITLENEHLRSYPKTDDLDDSSYNVEVQMYRAIHTPFLYYLLTNALISKNEPITLEQWWTSVATQLPDGHAIKDLTINELFRLRCQYSHEPDKLFWELSEDQSKLQKSLSNVFEAARTYK